MELVGDRFGLGTAYFYVINQVRRNGTELYVGDTLNLSAFTILSVGDENGVAYDNDPPSPIPEQL